MADPDFVTDRRSLLRGAGAGLAACALPGRALAAPYRTRHGDFDVEVISDGYLDLPTTFLGPGAPNDEREAALKAAGQTGERYQAPTNVTLIRTASDLILVDMGSGDRFMPSAGKLWENLEAAGIDKAKITKVIFTHGHPDHLWGTLDELDELVLPAASYFVPAAEWDFWHGSDALRGLPPGREGFVTGARRNFGHLKDKVTMVKPGDEIVAGMRALGTPGHTQGHLSLELAGGDGLVVGGDALTHPIISFQYPGWTNPADHQPERASETRRKLLDQLAASHAKLIGFHLPYPGLGVVDRKDSAFRFVSAA